MLKARPLLVHSLEGLRSQDHAFRLSAAKQVRACVLAEMRDGTTESFSAFLTELNRRIFELVSSSSADHTIGGILAIDALIDVPLEQNDKIIRFANYLRMVFSSSTKKSGGHRSSKADAKDASKNSKSSSNAFDGSSTNADSLALRLAARALGHLARSGGSLTVDFVEFEVTRALEWLQSDRFENRRLAAVLVLKELAENAPTLFYVHIHTFFIHIWAALRDPDVEIRVSATSALAACLNLIMDRESRLRIRWYYGIYETAQAGLRGENERGSGKSRSKGGDRKSTRANRHYTVDASNPDSIHGSLLAIGQLLVSTGDFIIPRFSEICDTIIRHKDHKDMLVKRTVVALLPALAEISPFAFVDGGYLSVSLAHLLDLVDKSNTRGDAFLSLGKLAVAVGSKIEPQLTNIIPLLQDGLSSRSKRGFCPEALKCASDLARAVGPALQVYMDDLLEQMFANGLSEMLASALSEIGTHIPLFLPLLQARVMQEISLILSGEPYMDPGSEGFDSLFIPTRALDFRLAAVRDKITNRRNGGSGDAEPSGGAKGKKQKASGKNGGKSTKGGNKVSGRVGDGVPGALGGGATGGNGGNALTSNGLDALDKSSRGGTGAGDGESTGGASHIRQSSAQDLKELSRQGMQKIRAAQEKRAKLRITRMSTLRGGLLAGGKGGEGGKVGLGERLLSKAGRSKSNRQSAASIYHSQKRKQSKKNKKMATAQSGVKTMTGIDDHQLLGYRSMIGVDDHAGMGMIPGLQPAVMLPGLLPCDDSAHITLVLRVLATFDMSGMKLLPFVHDIVALYLDDPDPGIRKQAVQTCTAVIAQYTDPKISPARGPTAWLRCKVLDRVLTIAVADHDSSIRSAAITALRTEFDSDLSQAKMLRSLFIALNDEVFEIREKTIAVIGRLTTRNPAYIMPSLRKMLIQLLTELEYSSDSRGREQSSQLLCHLIRASKRLVKPYATPILKVLRPRLRDPHPGVATSVLRTLGELSLVGGEELAPHLDGLLPIITEMIQDLGSDLKRTTALRTLGQLIRSTGAVVTPYYQYKSLLGNILGEITMGEAANTPWTLRKEVIRTLGVLGALDPYAHRQNVTRRRRMMMLIEDAEDGGDSDSLDDEDEFGGPVGAVARGVRDRSAGDSDGRRRGGSLRRRSRSGGGRGRRRRLSTRSLEASARRLKIQARSSNNNNDGLGRERNRDVDILTGFGGVGFGFNGGIPGTNWMNFDMMNEGKHRGGGSRRAAGGRNGGRKDPMFEYFGMSADEYNSYGLGDAEEAKHAVDEIAGALQDVQGPSHELYYPCVAISALVRVLRDPTLGTHHSLVAQAIMFIFRSLGLKCVPFLPQIVPTFIYVMNRCEHGLRESFFQQLGYLVGIVRQHIRPYLPHVFHMIQKYWEESTEQILSLVEQLSLALNDEFKKCLPKLIPLLILALGPRHSDRRRSTGSSLPMATSSAQHSSKRGVGIRGRGANMRYTHEGSSGLAGRGNGGDRGGGMRSNGMGVSRVGVGSVRRLPIQGYGRDEHTHHDRLVGGPMAGDVGGFMDIRPGESKTLYRMRLARASKNTVKALHALVVLGGNLADQLHLIVPSLLFLLERDGISVTVKAHSIHTMTRLCNVLNFSDYASRMVHSFARLLESVTSDGRGGMVVNTSASNSTDETGDIMADLDLTVLGGSASAESGTDRSMVPRDGNHHGSSRDLPRGGGHAGGGSSGGSKGGSEHQMRGRSSRGLLQDERALVRPTMDCLCALARQLGDGFAIFAPTLSRTLKRSGIVHAEFDECLRRLHGGYGGWGGGMGAYSANHHQGSNGDVGFQWGDGGAGGHQSSQHGGHPDRSNPPLDRSGGVAKLHVTQTNLQRAWTTRQRSTREDWLEWMRRFSVELLRESPDPALRSCASFAQVYHPLARELFNAAFLSCWIELRPQYRDYLVNALLSALKSPNIPPEILQALLNLAEFMEHDDKALPIDISQLSALATKCHAYAKALHYKELESASAEEPHLCTESLISINNKLGQPEAAKGILVHARQQAMQQGRHIRMEVSWFEKLGQWDDALKLYAKKLSRAPQDVDLMVGRMRCLQAIQEWEELAEQAAAAWEILEPQARAEQLREAKEEQAKALRAPRPSVADSEEMLRFDQASSSAPGSRNNSSANNPSADLMDLRSASPSLVGSRDSPGLSSERTENGSHELSHSSPTNSDTITAPLSAPGLVQQASARKKLQKVAMMGAQSSWYLDKWEDMNTYVGATFENEPNGALYRVITSIHSGNYESAKHYINKTRVLLDKTLSALVGESYQRAYKQIVVVQMLAELEEILVYKKLQKAAEDGDSAELRADASAYLDHLKRMWTTRLHGCQRSVDVWLRILSVRSLILTPKEDLYTYIEFARICRKDGRKSQLSGKILMALGWTVPQRLLRVEAESASRVREGGAVGPKIKLNLPNGMSVADDHPPELQQLSRDLQAKRSKLGGKVDELMEECHPRVLFSGLEDLWHSNKDVRVRHNILKELEMLVHEVPYVADNTDLLVRCQMRIGHWTMNLFDIEANLDEDVMATVLNAFEIATQLDPMYFKAWHAWALMNFRVVKIYERLCGGSKLAIKAINEWQQGNGSASGSRIGHPQPLDGAHIRNISGSTNSSQESDPGSDAFLGASSLNFNDFEAGTYPASAETRAPVGGGDEYVAGGGGGDGKDGSGAYPKRISPAVRVATHLVPAIQSFFNSVSVTLQQRRQRHRLVSNVLQDMLRLITLWFDYGELPMVNAAMREGFQMLSVDTWLYVIPQLIARIHTKEPHVHGLLHQLLCDIGRKHPQALIYPLTVAAHSGHIQRKSAAQAVLSRMREHRATLVDQAALVSSELIRVAILWHEMWHEGLEEASRLYFGQHDVEGMMAVIEPLYRMMEKGPQTLRETSFYQAFWREICDANKYLQEFKKNGKEADINQAWDLFYHVFRRINKQLPQLTTLGLQYVSPKLLEARNLELAVPGTYFSYDWIEEDDLWEDGLYLQADATSNTSVFTASAEAFATIAASRNRIGSDSGGVPGDHNFNGGGRGGPRAHSAVGLVGPSANIQNGHYYQDKRGSGRGAGSADHGYDSKEDPNPTSEGKERSEGKLSADEEANLAAAARAEARRRTSTMGVSRREVRIQSFVPSIAVITSKQRPRKILIRGSNGDEHTFLLKGHEDLRQDERVMQLFGLTNALLANHRDTSKRDLAIRRYAVIPLSPNCGIIGWVPHCDTLHQLIREFREQRKVRLSIEHMLMQQMAPDYDRCSLIQKVEVFKYALKNTDGLDLQKVLWLKSKNSEVWLDRRTNFTRSLAVMSMVGYILGLGDRHPSNLMLDRVSGKIIHIDFGDCFEVAMQRDKYPEKIPFRLTRMLVNAMEVSGIEGNYRSVCEVVMDVLREQRDSVMAMLEAFVHDPLINWGLIEKEQQAAEIAEAKKAEADKKQEKAKDTAKLDYSAPAAVEPLDTVGEAEEEEDDESTVTPATVLRVEKGVSGTKKPSTSVSSPEKPGSEEVAKGVDATAINGDVSSSDTSVADISGPMTDPGPHIDFSTTASVPAVQPKFTSVPKAAPIRKVGLRKVKRTSHKLSAMGGIKMPSVHDAIAKGDDRLAMKLSTSGMAQSFSVRGRSMRASYRGSQGTDNGSSGGTSTSSGVDVGGSAPRSKKSSGILNQKAIKVTARVRDKLTGKDFGNDVPLDAPTQVQRLIMQATSHDNLSQCYIGWCPFW